MIANKYRDTLKVLEQDLDSTRAGSIENAAARVQTAQVKQKKCRILLSSPLVCVSVSPSSWLDRMLVFLMRMHAVCFARLWHGEYRSFRRK